ncbi:MAG: hypothetical protein R3B70_27560 [Polyangiaceae bacterium]
MLPALVLSATAALAAGQSVHAAQLCGLLPAHMLLPDLVLFPLMNATWEACLSQTALFTATLALALRLRLRLA